MFYSLRSRVIVLSSLVVLAVVALAAALTAVSLQLQSSARWVEHTQTVLEMAAKPIDRLRRAESDLRGMIISHDPSLGAAIDADLRATRSDMDRLVQLTADNPPQHARALRLRAAVLDRIAFLSEGTRLARVQRIATVAPVRVRTSWQLMRMVDQRRDELVEAEQALLLDRNASTHASAYWLRVLAMAGGLIVGFAALTIAFVITRGVGRPTAVLSEAMEELGSGDASGRIALRTMGSREFRRLARGYNVMAERLAEALEKQHRSEEDLSTINQELLSRSHLLEARSEVAEYLGDMMRRLQASRSDAEFAKVIERFVPLALPDTTGAVYTHNNSRNQLVRAAAWGSASDLPDTIAPDACWAMRLGQSHAQSPFAPDVDCAHAEGREAYHCEPLLAGGELIGILHIAGEVDGADEYRLQALSETLSSALMNYRLQRNLREQTIRDAMTGLFNRRYLEEALAIEIARAARARTPLTVVMCDVDHFKRFNDEFGHEAGDHVLRMVAEQMRAHFRDGDILCRYGGEEFTIIAPGVTPEILATRIEKLRLAISKLSLRHGGQSLGPTSMSFGVAAHAGETQGEGSGLLQAADEALYRAKRAGRNRMVIAGQLAA
ncbi:diguanylate cyclase [Sphingomonas morindae]|uniref:diguanylate cyclase n=1 Tax=Sphingomonas morindae TaxID=1541170 RepID=A0ABY4XDD8_9SPHN|nr:diguanylate cyclase [Sphingomonas morindae]USI74938.1 diguanylate cyclase [Sphingomonas morindae]